MVSPKFLVSGGKRSLIRELSEYGAAQAAIVGKDNVYDFSLGNPSTPPPKEVEDAIIDIIKNDDPVEVHGYSSNMGLDSCRQAIAESYNRRFGTGLDKKNFMMTTGASTALNVVSLALNIDEQSEIMVIAPYFPGYTQACDAGGNRMVVVPPDMDGFQINFAEMERLITPHTQGVIINSPNNPTGVIYSAETIQRVGELLEKKSREYGHAIYIICDEPYRELVYTDAEVPYIPKYYRNTIICYSYSKSLSLAGERVGYIATDNNIDDFEQVWIALRGAAGIVANVCAPTLFQKVVERCVDVAPNMADYVYNRNLLMDAFAKIGYEFARPDGAFYLYFKAPFGMDAQEFSELAKKYNVLLVPGFGCPGYLRLSYCASRRSCEACIPFMQKLYDEAREIMAKK